MNPFIVTSRIKPLRLIPFCLVVLAHPLAALPAVDDPALVRLLDTPDETVFAGRFSQLLLDMPADGLPGFRAMLTKGLLEKKLPRRHAWTALGLTDTRWAETDTAGFIAACKAGMKELPVQGRLHAATLLLESDADAAIRAARELRLDANNGMPGFLAALTARDPRKALDVLKEITGPSGASLAASAIFRVWAEKDAAAAWAGIPETAGSDPLPRRVIVCSTAARKDAAAALAMIASLAKEADRIRLQESVIRSLAAENGHLALDFVRRIDSAAAWNAFAASARFGSDVETLRQLLEVLPKPHLESGLTAMFTRNDDPVQPAFPNSRMLPLLTDPARRRAMVLAICEAKRRTYNPLPAAVVDAALTLGPEMLSEQTPEPDRKLLLENMLRRDPIAMLPWMLALREVEWAEFRRDMVYKWPLRTIAEDIRRLQAGKHPREQELGRELAGRWWNLDPFAAFSTAASGTDSHFPGRIDFDYFLEKSGGDAAQVEGMLSSIADGRNRALALRSFRLWQTNKLPPREALAGLLEILDEPGARDHPGVYAKFSGRGEVEIDALIDAIPAARQEDRDRLSAARAVHLMSGGEEQRALRMWAGIRSEVILLESLREVLRGEKPGFTRWNELFGILGSRPAAADDKDLMDGLGRELAKAHGAAATAIAGKVPARALRKSLLASIEPRIPNPANAPSWQRALALGLKTDEGARMGVLAIKRMAENDPKAALAALIQAGEAAMHASFLQPVMRQLIPQDPAVALESAMRLTGSNGMSLVDFVVGEWSRIDRRAAAEACLRISPSDGYSHLLPMTLDAWLNVAPAEALEWVFALPGGESRQAALKPAIRHLAAKDPVRAAEWILTTPGPTPPEDLALEVSRNLAAISYQKSCRFLLELDPKIPAAKLRQAWQSQVIAWMESDPNGGAAFLKSLPGSDAVNALNTGLGGKLLPRYAELLAGWNPPPDPAEDAPKTLLEKLRQGELANAPLSDREFAELREAILAMPASAASDTVIVSLATHALRQGRADQVIPWLRAIAAKREPLAGGDPLAGCMAEIVGRLLYDRSPDTILAFVKSLAAENPAWLDAAVGVLWRDGGRDSAPSFIRPLRAEALLLVPQERRAAILARSFSMGSRMPDELIRSVLAPSPDTARLELLAAVSVALAANKPAAALQAAARLPVADGDPLVRRILAGFATADDATAAIGALEDAAARERAAAWWKSLHPAE